jgi:transcriptional regulator with XRE-family HTH domain
LKQPISASLGAKLRHRRKLLGLTLSAVAKAAGCSESMVSKIETDRVNPSLTMLRRLTAALDINVAKLFTDAPVEGVVSRYGERPRIDTDALRRGDQVSLERLVPYHDGALLQANIHIIGPGGSSDGQITHVGEEMGYLLEGQLELAVDGCWSRWAAWSRRRTISRSSGSAAIWTNVSHRSLTRWTW